MSHGSSDWIHWWFSCTEPGTSSPACTCNILYFPLIWVERSCLRVCDIQMFSFQHQQKGVSPRMFKSLVSRGHPEFSSNRQQDAHEFLLHMINLVEVSGDKPLFDFYLLLLLFQFARIYVNVYTCCSWLLKCYEYNIYIGASLHTSTDRLYHNDRTEWDAVFHKTDRPLLLFYKMTVIRPTPDTHGPTVDWEGRVCFWLSPWLVHTHVVLLWCVSLKQDIYIYSSVLSVTQGDR